MPLSAANIVGARRTSKQDGLALFVRQPKPLGGTGKSETKASLLLNRIPLLPREVILNELIAEPHLEWPQNPTTPEPDPEPIA